METINAFISEIVAISKYLILPFFVLGTIENLLLIRYGGNPKRGFKIWSQSLNDDEWRFLSNLKEDILEERKSGLWNKKKSFIMTREGRVLIRSAISKQGTSWPIVGYVDLQSADRLLEYRLSIIMFLMLLTLAVMNIYLGLFLSVAFFIGSFSEIVGLRDFLTRKTEVFLQR